MSESESVVLKAYGGDRAKNLESIADEIDSVLGESVPRDGNGHLLLSELAAHQIRGYCEQLRIIADEWPRPKDQK